MKLYLKLIKITCEKSKYSKKNSKIRNCFITSSGIGSKLERDNNFRTIRSTSYKIYLETSIFFQNSLYRQHLNMTFRHTSYTRYDNSKW